MDQIVRLDSHQEATLEDAADRFIAKCHGDVRKALKEMMVVNAHLNDQLERIISAQAGAGRSRAPDPERIRRQLSHGNQDQSSGCLVRGNRARIGCRKGGFREAGISAERAAEASFAIEGWDEAGFPDDDSYPDDEDFAFAHVWGEADEAAAAACCQDWPEEKRVRTADLELDDPEADARRAKMMAEMEAYSRGLTPDLFEKEWKMRPGQPCRSSLTVPLPIRPPLVVAH